MATVTKKQLCGAAQFALNQMWEDKAQVSIINPELFWFTVTYTNAFDARQELTSLGIDYDAHPKNWVRGEYVQDFFMTGDTWDKLRERWLKDYANQ